MIQQTLGKALVTGASTGIGSVYADRLAHRGYDLVLVARNRRLLDDLALRLTHETGRTIEVISADLSKTTDLAIVEKKLREDSQITLLVNNAGFAAVTPLVDSDVEQMDDMLSVNIRALMRLTYAAVPGFTRRGKGAVINISSIVALAPELLNGVYSGTKAFVLAFTQSLQNELAGKNVRIQAVLPGATATPIWANAGHSIEKLPPDWVMTAEAMVDASLAGFDQGELITVPALPNIDDWNAFESARKALGPNLSHKVPAARYGVA